MHAGGAEVAEILVLVITFATVETLQKLNSPSSSIPNFSRRYSFFFCDSIDSDTRGFGWNRVQNVNRRSLSNCLNVNFQIQLTCFFGIGGVNNETIVTMMHTQADKTSEK